jgi:hypothetical protein
MQAITRTGFFVDKLQMASLAAHAARAHRNAFPRARVKQTCTLAHEMFEKTVGEYYHRRRQLNWIAWPPTRRHRMTIGTSKRKMTFRMPFVLGGFDDAMSAP